MSRSLLTDHSELRDWLCDSRSCQSYGGGAVGSATHRAPAMRGAWQSFTTMFIAMEICWWYRSAFGKFLSFRLKNVVLIFQLHQLFAFCGWCFGYVVFAI